MSEHHAHLFEVGLLLSHDGIERSWRVEIRLLDPDGHPVEEGAIVLDHQFADQAGTRVAHGLIEERLNAPSNYEPHQSGHPCSPGIFQPLFTSDAS
jgi:hypothetical protein